ncbi:hypothetical protein PHYBLDRAFT_159270 [Phycomyces blakesleeanus NRRL 1555(-)]|uniref:Secreted protein n=1 Tax=Phycomyces blakesleeanus (strain ATCC 8743b / DSM 1359 / FGSC 10004 / NBRC 33097 / NRRL 1555) TaxID=763407 RepID=A0A167M059_PHYB8|nr:hypothetical protein PHYBLDRAFT_159270 [Phycomyces blakesleeanus NRRL 1555(-)]OAD71446.1 hypothetical protein PHYBLDRAFT_159270 [Phycomyces blakesleeanus NRRL 1555(-)]|eukprot:XP_018289486.1 hypothetical protein PHYBLDRAFT_159270 [Phycomyces blakesleeanus NRRL 1555(-)]
MFLLSVLIFLVISQFIPTIRRPISIQGYRHTSLLHHLLTACFICPESSQLMSTVTVLTYISNHSCIFPYFLRQRPAIKVSLSIKILSYLDIVKTND